MDWSARRRRQRCGRWRWRSTTSESTSWVAEGWRVRSAPHFAEWHGLIVIIALGESIVAIGVGVAALPVTWPILVAATLGLTITVCLWWLYFDVVALGLKKVLEYVADAERHTLSDALSGVPLAALYGGVAAYLLAHIAFRWRNVRSISIQRLVVAGGLLALIPVAAQLPALASLGVLAAVLTGLVAFEVMHYAEPRREVRHATH